MERTISAQQELYGRIARTAENLRKMGAAKVSQSLVQSTLALLDKKWTKFEEQHDQLRNLHWEELKSHEYLKSDFLSKVEDVYLQQRSLLLDMEAALPCTRTKAEDPRSAAPNCRPARAPLPPIQLPKFSGRFEDWPAFKDLFVSLISTDKTLKDVEKLHYLKLSLTNDAERLIRNLAVTGENLHRAWSMLADRYENKRLLVTAYLNSFVALPKVKTDSAVELRRLYHGVLNTVGSLEGIGRPIANCTDLFVHLAVDLLDQKSRRDWETAVGVSVDPPTYERLVKFLEQKLNTAEALAVGKSERDMSREGSSRQAARTLHAGARDSDRGRCPLCAKNHYVLFCEKFKARSAKERKSVVDKYHLCVNCLGKHSVAACSSAKSCLVCAERHHSSMHEAFEAATPARGETTACTAALVSRPMAEAHSGRLLATARVRVADRFGELRFARALLDPCSEVTLITEALVQRLRLARAPASLAIVGVGRVGSGIVRGRVEVSVHSRLGVPAASVSAYVLPQLTSYGRRHCVTGRSWPHLSNLELADPGFREGGAVDLLLGADAFSTLILEGVRKGKPGEPIALKTLLGWVISGEIDAGASPSSVTVNQCSVDGELSVIVRRFWEQEEAPNSPPPLTSEENDCLQHFSSTHSRREDGRYQVRLPLRSPLPELAGTRRAALRSLLQTEQRFRRDSDFSRSYSVFMDEYEKLGHMSPALPVEREERQCFLPHHGVLRDVGSGAKLRVVFNGSQRTFAGASLNSALSVGPNLLPRLADVLLAWRQHRYVYVTDVEKMYRQILVHPDDRDLQRVLWRDGGEVREYRLNTVTYGLACAPFLAIRTLRQLATDEGGECPLGARALTAETYMDDVLTGAATIDEVLELRAQLTRICGAGGFPLRKWAANEPSLLAAVPEAHRSAALTRTWRASDSGHHTLGLEWKPAGDSFAFVIRPVDESATTKRGVLSQAARLFDPLGWMSPVTVTAKCLLQSTWLRGVSWDDRLPEEDVAAWAAFCEELSALRSLHVPRWVGLGSSGGEVEVHGFADASERAYAAVAYLLTKGGDDIKVSLLLAKTRVAPLRQISLPRLELCAASLLVAVVAHVLKVLQLPATSVHLWTDSMVALGWIRGHSSRWTTFVANRVSEVQRTLPDARWHHVPGELNPADCASRGITPGALLTHPLWWRGPEFLTTRQWPLSDDHTAEDQLPEQRRTVHLVALREPESEMLIRYSTLSRLLRVTAWVLRWRPRGRVEAHRQRALTPGELLLAEERWVLHVQSVAYTAELKALDGGRPLPPRSPLRKLTPFRDERGVLRVGGRLKHAVLSYDERHPILLPQSSHLTGLVVEAFHRRTLHGGTQLTLSLIRRKYWIPRGRLLVKRRIHLCPACVRWRAASPQPMMSSLPGARVVSCRPFLRTGVDYAGPVLLRSARGRGQKSFKAFMAIFICFTTRAVHLEIVSDYSADAFLAAFRRFTSRRGICHHVYSDCGTNFVGADSQLRALFRASSSAARTTADQLATQGTRWHFNPPGAPHFGGLWEAAVKSVKHHLRRVLGTATLTYEEMATLLAQVEACLNSRPLQALSDDPDDLTALTPGHFLIGEPLCALPEPSVAGIPRGRLDRWRMLQQMRDHLWQRWSQEYVTSLLPRTKWLDNVRNVEVGRLCLIRSEATPPSKWPLARITQVHYGDGGQVRVVTVRTATTTLNRPVVKIVPLPISANDNEKA